MSLPALLTLVVCIFGVTAVDQKVKGKVGKVLMTVQKAGKDMMTVQKTGEDVMTVEKNRKGEMTEEPAGKGEMAVEKVEKGEMTVEKAQNEEMTDQKAGQEMKTEEKTFEGLDVSEMADEEGKTTAMNGENNRITLPPMKIEIFNKMVMEKYGVAETTGCNSPEALDIIKDHIVKDKVTDLLAGKTFTDVWRREVCVSFMMCVLTKFSMKDGDLVNEVVAVRTDQSNNFEEKWKETSVNGVFTVNGVWHNEKEKNPTFTDTLRFFYVDDNVIGTYTCRQEGLFSESNVWMVAISVVEDKVDSEEVKESLKKAEEEMKKIRELSGEMDKLKRENCPQHI